MLFVLPFFLLLLSVTVINACNKLTRTVPFQLCHFIFFSYVLSHPPSSGEVNSPSLLFAFSNLQPCLKQSLPAPSSYFVPTGRLQRTRPDCQPCSKLRIVVLRGILFKVSVMYFSVLRLLVPLSLFSFLLLSSTHTPLHLHPTSPFLFLSFFYCDIQFSMYCTAMYVFLTYTVPPGNFRHNFRHKIAVFRLQAAPA